MKSDGLVDGAKYKEKFRIQEASTKDNFDAHCKTTIKLAFAAHGPIPQGVQ